MTDELIIRDEAVARALLEPKNLTLLELLLQNERSLSDLAEKLNVNLNTMLYRVNALIRLGLVEVSREVKRSGRASKRYRTTARKFLIPIELIPHAHDEQISDKLTANIFDNFRRDYARTLEGELGPSYLQVSTGEHSEGIFIANVFQKNSPNFLKPDLPAIMQSAGLVHLDFAEAKAFQSDLIELFKKYVEDNESEGQAYYFLLGLTPASSDKPSPWQ